MLKLCPNPDSPKDGVDAERMGLVIHFERVRAGNVELSIARAGEGPAVILLHGFPENWTAWRGQIPALVRAGFSVWVPDLRGYNWSDKPTERAAYHLRHLSADVAAIVRATGQSTANLVGHDWGGVIAWTFAQEHPELLSTLTILNAPHMKLYRRELLRLRQLLKSWYVLFFQIPWLSEFVLSFNDFAIIRRMFRSSVREGTFNDEDIDVYVDPFQKCGALTAALNYYRANFHDATWPVIKGARISTPTLVLWGERDPALSIHLLDGLEEVAANVEVKRLPNAGHWVQNEAAGEVNGALLGFLSHHRSDV